MSNQLAQFSPEDLQHAIIEYGPAIVVAEGKTATERRVGIISQASDAAKLFAANQKGKVGMTARAGLQERGMAQIASNARRGNYKPLAESLALITGESTTITSRAAYESLKDRYQPKLDDLVRTDKYMKGDKLTSKASMYMQCLMLIDATYKGVEAIIANEKKGDEKKGDE